MVTYHCEAISDIFVFCYWSEGQALAEHQCQQTIVTLISMASRIGLSA